MTTEGITREVASILQLPQYISFKQNSGERFRAIWPSCFSLPPLYHYFIKSKTLYLSQMI